MYFPLFTHHLKFYFTPKSSISLFLYSTCYRLIVFLKNEIGYPEHDKRAKLLWQNNQTTGLKPFLSFVFCFSKF